jgi:hypothetical protein
LQFMFCHQRKRTQNRNTFVLYIVAYLPHARTDESRKPRNTHAAIELRVFIARC